MIKGVRNLITEILTHMVTFHSEEIKKETIPVLKDFVSLDYLSAWLTQLTNVAAFDKVNKSLEEVQRYNSFKEWPFQPFSIVEPYFQKLN